MSPVIPPWIGANHNAPIHLRLTAPRPPTVDYDNTRGRKDKKEAKEQAMAEAFSLRVQQVGIVLGLRASGLSLEQISSSLGYPAPWAGWVIEEAEKRNMIDRQPNP